ncbi:unnamed protein product [Echinostoma caproni]|uniref:Reverse transcriptase domain-containing protein n=1 Tax=Echinostoma caproni TaxID=27848 RepID=A0A183A636_9TREM|nr:unnamed protein product [Echinostoma caproni]
MTNSPQHKMAKWLIKVLEPVLKSMIKYTVKDSFELVDILNKINIEEKHMASFDVQSMFTNVAVREVIQIICDHVEKKNIQLYLPVSVLERLLLLCTTDASFSFQGNAYRQIDGVAMGSPRGTVLLDLFMAHLEEKVTNILGRAILYKRYVDDTLVITESLEEATKIVDQLNRIHPNIYFTMEYESNNTLNFLGITMTRRENGTIARSVYRKET